jgi:hypothetical protein
MISHENQINGFRVVICGRTGGEIDMEKINGALLHFLTNSPKINTASRMANQWHGMKYWLAPRVARLVCIKLLETEILRNNI